MDTCSKLRRALQLLCEFPQGSDGKVQDSFDDRFFSLKSPQVISIGYFSQRNHWADAIIVLRIQLERMDRGLFPSVREYRNLFGITSERLKKHKKEIVIMHPGPMNRGVEIDSSVADGKEAIILDQVLNGVASRMAILYLLLGGKPENN